MMAACSVLIVGAGEGGLVDGGGGGEEASGADSTCSM